MGLARLQLYGYKEEVNPGQFKVIDPGVEDNQCFICRGPFEFTQRRVFVNWQGADRLYFLRVHEDCVNAMSPEKVQEVLATAVVLDQQLWADLAYGGRRPN